ncbi:hypothetical protein UM89_13295 [Bacillus subtilis]|nr:hypothetical protein UM89_13295 [Bacillus subtilis]
MNDNKCINNSKKELELGKYLESDMIALTDDDVVGGITPYVSAASIWVSKQTCPSTVCTRAC